MKFQMLFVALLAVVSYGYGPGFAPGWNGLAEKPPMGWRSWNSYGARVSETNMKVWKVYKKNMETRRCTVCRVCVETGIC